MNQTVFCNKLHITIKYEKITQKKKKRNMGNFTDDFLNKLFIFLLIIINKIEKREKKEGK